MAAVETAGGHATVTVNLDSDPPEADVEWSGQHMGRTPARLDLPSGVQMLTLARDGYYDETLRIDVPASAPEPIVRVVKLRSKTPTLIGSGSATSPPSHPGAPRSVHAGPSPAPSPTAPTTPTTPGTSAPAALAPKDSW